MVLIMNVYRYSATPDVEPAVHVGRQCCGYRIRLRYIALRVSQIVAPKNDAGNPGLLVVSVWTGLYIEPLRKVAAWRNSLTGDLEL